MLPAQTARAGIERNQVCIEAGVVDRVAKYRDAAVCAATAQAEILGKFPAVGPVAAASASVQRHDFVGRLGDVQDAVDRDGRSFNGVRLMDLMDPGDPEAVSVGGVDLVQQRVPLAVVAARVGEPVAGLLVRVADALVRDIEGTLLRQRQRQGQQQSQILHFASRSETRYAMRSSSSVPVNLSL